MNHFGTSNSHQIHKQSLTSFIVNQNGGNNFPNAVSLAGLGRMSVPIKQYSNKFFKDIESDPHMISTHSDAPKNNHKKINTLIRKKQMFGKQQSIR